MTGATAQGSYIVEVIERYGRCLELVTMDPNFHEITVGLYVKGEVATVWTFSRKPGIEERVEQICSQLVRLGGMEPVAGTHNQVRLPCGQIHEQPLRFLIRQAVEKPPDQAPPEGRVKDLRSGLMLGFEVAETDGCWVYRITAEGEARNKSMRIRAATNGLVRYGQMEKTGDGAAFVCGYRHDALVALVLPYARNVTGTQDMLEAERAARSDDHGHAGLQPTDLGEFLESLY